ncbi:MAG: DUF3108 domain-containing protein [Gammaproteobacteria bacterium]|nr:DUF3108 domain-containing protein [Gammaproteobacteria bacterium]
MRWLISWMLVFSSSVAQAATFKYHAYIGGVKAGHATVHVNLDEESYEVSGSARAEGLVDALNSWYTRFSSTGRFVDGNAELIEYRYVEKGDHKRRDVTVRDGELRVIKNGKQRPLRPAFPGVDVLTALYVDPTCEEEKQLHSGRHSYVLKRIETDNDVCRYHVTDDDGDSYRAEFVYGEVQNITVPLSITVTGFLTARMILVEGEQ